MKAVTFLILGILLFSGSIISFHTLYEEKTSSCWNAGCGKYTEFTDAFKPPQVLFSCIHMCQLRYAETFNDTNLFDPSNPPETVPYHYTVHNPLYVVLLYLAIIALLISIIQLYKQRKTN